jgi:hypothetical protein
VVQGSVETGIGAFFDTGDGADTFTQAPARPVCQGVRGQGYWVDCGVGLGFGVNS